MRTQENKSNPGRHLRDMMRQSTKKAQVIAVTSGKGGVGKTNISANLAISLAAAGRQVMLVDADLSLGNLDVLMNINPKYNIAHMLNGKKSIDEIVHIGPEGIKLVCGVSGLAEMADLSEFERRRIMNELSTLQDNNDIMIIDNAAGISKSVVSFCLAADHTLVVTTPEATAMTDAYAMIKVLVKNDFKGRISVVVNMADSYAEGKKVYQQISTVAWRFLNEHVYDAGVLVRDDCLGLAIRKRKPVVLAYPKSRVTASIVALAAKLGRTSAVKPAEQGFFRKVVDWFF